MYNTLLDKYYLTMSRSLCITSLLLTYYANATIRPLTPPTYVMLNA